MFEIIAITSIVVAAGLLQGLTGFGFVLIALPLLDFFIPLKTLIPLLCLLALCISLYLSIQLRKSIHFSRIGLMLLANIPGIPLGVLLLKQLPSATLSLALGMLMISFTAYQLLAKPQPRELGRASALFAGFSSGILGGSIGAGGPPVIIYSATQRWSKDEAKGTLAFFFFISGGMVVLMHAFTGLVTQTVIHYFTISIPALAVGILFGIALYKRISDHGYRKLAFVLVFLLGWMMVIRNI